jgi:hypothetical protein
MHNFLNFNNYFFNLNINNIQIFMVDMFEIVDDELYVVKDDNIYNIGEIFDDLTNKNFVSKQKIDNWKKYIDENITFKFLIDEINDIDEIAVKTINDFVIGTKNISIDIKFQNITDFLYNKKYDSKMGPILFNMYSKDKYNIFCNDIDFIKFCFSLYKIDIFEVLKNKFPKGVINTNDGFIKIIYE